MMRDMPLSLRRIPDWFGGTITQVVSDGECCRQPATLAHVGFEVVAMTLAEPLRRALDLHLDEHGCGTGDPQDPRYVGGFIHCPEAAQLWDMLPAGDRIVIG
jgi:hypothetical protein